MQKEKLTTFTQHLRSNLYERITSQINPRMSCNFKKAGYAMLLTFIFGVCFNSEHPSMHEQLANMAVLILMGISVAKGIVYLYDALQYRSFKKKLAFSWFDSGKESIDSITSRLWSLTFSLKENFYFPNDCDRLSKEEVQQLFALPLEEYDITVLNDAIQTRGYIHYDDIMKLHFVTNEEYQENIQDKINTFIADNNLTLQQHNVSLLSKLLLPTRTKYMNGRK